MAKFATRNTAADGSDSKISKNKSNFNTTLAKIKGVNSLSMHDRIEIPRQQEDGPQGGEQAIMGFSAAQKLLNPNQDAAAAPTRINMPKKSTKILRPPCSPRITRSQTAAAAAASAAKKLINPPFSPRMTRSRTAAKQLAKVPSATIAAAQKRSRTTAKQLTNVTAAAADTTIAQKRSRTAKQLAKVPSATIANAMKRSRTTAAKQLPAATNTTIAQKRSRTAKQLAKVPSTTNTTAKKRSRTTASRQLATTGTAATDTTDTPKPKKRKIDAELKRANKLLERILNGEREAFTLNEEEEAPKPPETDDFFGGAPDVDELYPEVEMYADYY